MGVFSASLILALIINRSPASYDHKPSYSIGEATKRPMLPFNVHKRLRDRQFQIQGVDMVVEGDSNLRRLKRQDSGGGYYPTAPNQAPTEFLGQQQFQALPQASYFQYPQALPSVQQQQFAQQQTFVQQPSQFFQQQQFTQFQAQPQQKFQQQLPATIARPLPQVTPHPIGARPQAAFPTTSPQYPTLRPSAPVQNSPAQSFLTAQKPQASQRPVFPPRPAARPQSPGYTAVATRPKAPAQTRRPSGGAPVLSNDAPGLDSYVASRYYYPPREPLPLPKCFYNPTGYVCCNENLNDLIVDTYSELEVRPRFHTCNINALAIFLQERAEKRFNTSFETVIGFEDFAQKIHFHGDLVCKVELGGKYMLAYATAKDVTETRLPPIHNPFKTAFGPINEVPSHHISRRHTILI